MADCYTINKLITTVLMTRTEADKQKDSLIM